MYNPVTKTHVLIADNCLIELNQKKELTLTEKELAVGLRAYNLRSGLETLGNYSRKIFKDRHTPQSAGRGGYIDVSGVFVTQFAISYISNILLISGANDWKQKLISDKENVLLLLNMYSNLLLHRLPPKDTAYSQEEALASMFIRMSFEQFEYQFEPVNIISRNTILFLEVASKHAPDKFDALDSIFLKETGITIKQYFTYSFFIFACVYESPLFAKTRLIGAPIEGYEDYFTEENIDKYLNLVSTDYRSFRELDTILNKNLDPLDTRNRYNPLKIYPIIKTDKVEDNSPYVVPNIINFIFKGFEGMFWWFDNYFQSKGKFEDYRTYFGHVFEDYVGLVLKDAYGEAEVKPEIKYKKGKFIDWYIEKEDKVYLFEAKANQFSLPVLQTGDIELIQKEVKKKLLEAVKQVYERISEIDTYEELKQFRGKKIIPIIIFLDIPLVSSGGYKKIIYPHLVALETEAKYKGISQFVYHFLNVEELEDYAYVSGITPIEDIFETIKTDQSKGFTSEVYRLIGNKKNKKNLIDRKFAEYGKEFGVGEILETEIGF